MNDKQVILVRTDLNMPVGKIAAQVAHASLAVILNKMETSELNNSNLVNELGMSGLLKQLTLYENTPLYRWITGSFTKIVLGVDTEDEMMNIYYKAKTDDMLVSLIKDEGRTVFNGVPTNTCVAIGPSEAHIIDRYTGHLNLLK